MSRKEEEKKIEEKKTEKKKPSKALKDGFVEGADGQPVKLRDAALQPVTEQEK